VKMQGLLQAAANASGDNKRRLIDEIKQVINDIGALGNVDRAEAQRKLDAKGLNATERQRMENEWKKLQSSQRGWCGCC